MIGLLTFHWADDYGAMLQAYALKRCLEQLDGTAEVIPYAPRRLEGRYRWFPLRYRNQGGTMRFWLYRSIRGWLRHPFPSKDLLNRRRIMAQFRQRYLTAGRPLRKANDISLAKYSCVFVGSDQVWNPAITLGLDDAYIGNIPGRGSCCFTAYAASLGGKELPEECREKFAACVSEAFRGISLRERRAVPFVERLLGREVTDTLDPVLLLERREWEGLALSPAEEGYVLVYQTEPNEPLMQYARRTAERLGNPVVDVSFFRGRKASGEQRAAIGPAEFVGYVQNAACVVTNSFHGTAFSVLLEKKFVVFPHSTKNTRMEDLLEKLGLGERMAAGASLPEEEIIWQDIQWPDVMERLDMERERSMDFIRENIQISGGLL